ncbi:cob(I)yrinic acid a,c-diamide adenosyltransferase [Patescibacteria group bacterium]|nr:cob(I)yrinic acid a,c-diamide adenosyltransferase [Patescibacteria group bacterium]
MNKIYTKTGDKGETSMLGGKRVSKSCLEMEAIGEVDELNSWLGILIEEIEDDFKKETKKLREVQKDLFLIGANLASLQMPKTKSKLADLQACRLVNLEKWIDAMEKDLSKLKSFIFYTGSEEAVKAFYARAICRRAERVMIALSEKYEVNQLIKQYLNRLSDLLFVLARWLNKQEGVNDVRWEKI